MATTLPAWRTARAVDLPDALIPQQLIPQQRPAESTHYLFARGNEVQFGGAARSTPKSNATEPLEIVRSRSSGRDVVLSVDTPRQSSGSVAPSKPASKPPATKTTADASQPARRAANRNPQSLASALFPVRVSATNPYGDIDDRRGLRPYNPGQKYDREPDDRDSSFFGALFGR
jgi:hypothetical protein